MATENNINGGSNELNDNAQNEFDDHVTNFFIELALPLSVIDNSLFKNMFITSKLNVMTKSDLQTRVDYLFNKLIDDMKNKVKLIDNVYLETVYYKIQDKDYLSTACEWIGNDFKRNRFIISCRPFKSKEFKDVKDAGIETIASINDFKRLRSEDQSQSSLLISDNAVPEYRGNHLIVSATFENESPKDVKFGTALAPLVTTLMQGKLFIVPTLHQVIKKYIDLWQIIKDSENDNLIKELFKSKDSVEIVRSILNDSTSDWYIYELYRPLQRVSSISSKLNEVYNNLNVNNDKRLHDDDFTVINDFSKSMKPFGDCFKMIENDTDKYYGLFLPCLLSLRQKVENLIKLPNNTCMDILVEMKSLMYDIFANFFDISTEEAVFAALATISYPRFKDKWLSITDMNWQHKVKAAFEEAILNEIVTVVPEIKKESFFEFEMESKSEKEMLTYKVKAKMIMNQYLTDKDEDITMLNRHKVIKKIFFKYNTTILLNHSIGLAKAIGMVPNLGFLEDPETFGKIVLLNIRNK